MQVREEDFADERVRALLRFHLDDFAPHSPAESRHALDLSGVRAPGVTIWSFWEGDALLGFGGFKHLDDDHAEVKSMRVAPDRLRRGVGGAILTQIIEAARARGYRRLSLETGTHLAFAPAHALYRRFGFEDCGPFGDYRLDPFSCFMSRAI